MTQYEEYLESEYLSFTKSDLYNLLIETANKTNYTIDIFHGVIKEKNNDIYCISINVIDEYHKFIELYDDGQLSAFVTLVNVKKNKAQFYKWNDIDFTEDIEKIIDFLIINTV